MAGNTIVFTSLTAANPYTPPPTGYTKPSGSDNAKIEATVSNHFGRASGTNAIWYDNTSMQGSVIVAKVLVGFNIFNLMGACIVNASGNGYCFLAGTSANTFRYFFVVNGQLGTQIGSTIAVAPTVSVTYQFERNTTTGVMRILDAGGTQIGASSPADLTYSDARFAGAITRGGYIVSLTSDYTPNQTVTSINGGNPITASQTTSSAVTTGFTGLPSTITSNLSGLTFSGIGGSTNAPTFSKSVPIDGAVYPQRGLTATVTFTNGSETASGAIDIDADADQTTVVVASPINDDITCLFGAIFAVTGRSAANGDEVYHTVPVGMSDLVVNPDGTMEVTNEGTFSCWVWTIATGVNYYYSVTITESGAVVVPPTTRPLGGRPVRSSLGRQIWPITPHATNPVGGSGETKKAYGIKVSGAGTVVIRTEGGDEDVTITLAAGATLPVVVTHVRDTSTATGILGYSIF